MANNESCSCTENSPRNNQIIPQIPCNICNCDWESKIGQRIAVSLVLLEIKRFFLLALEMIIELPVLQFSGAIKSVIFSFIDVALGIPCALAAISSIRKRQEQPRYSKVKILLKFVVLIIVICALLNIVTLASIGYHVSVKQSTIKGIFNSSMHNYLTDNYYKYNLDEIQFELQCCGHTTYTDWLLFDWKKSERVTRKKKNLRAINSDKDDRGVPFSCCNIHSLLPCVHNIQMTEADVKTINSHGCSKILSYILIRIVVFGYVMTALAIIIYVVLLYFIIKITRKPLPQDCPSDCSCLSSEDDSPRCPLIQQNCSCSSSSSSLSVGKEMPYLTGKRNSKTLQTFRRSSFYWRNDSFNKRKRTRRSSCSSFSDESSITEYSKNREIAQIKPSVHEQHEISQKSSKCSMIMSKVDSR